LGRPIEESQIPACPEKSWESTVVCLVTTPDKYGLNNGKPSYSISGTGFGYITTAVLLDETGVVSQVVVEMDNFRFGGFLKVLIAKYGDPTEQSEETIQSQGGATYPNLQSTWIGSSMSILALERHGRVDRSAVFFSDLSALSRRAAADRAKAASAAGRL
jgi:hypothetical protein